jgi:hypothetical protein
VRTTHHSAVLNILCAHKLINMRGEKPRSYRARSGITPRYLLFFAPAT